MDTTTLVIVALLVVAAWAATALYLLGVLAERRDRKNRNGHDEPDNR